MMNDHQLTCTRGVRIINRAKLAAIYDDYHKAMYQYIYRRVGEVEIARDLTSDLFGSLLKAAQNGRGPDQNIRAWLYRSAHNIVIDYYRYRQHRQHLPLSEELVSAHNDPVRLSEAHFSADMVRAALRQLTPDQQQVISLKFLEGLSNQEIAEVLNKPVGAVKSLQHRALAALHRILAPEKEAMRL